MTTQAKHLFRAVEVRNARAVGVANRPPDTQTPVSQARHVDPLRFCSTYKGYGLTAHALPTKTDLYAADVVIERPGHPASHFRALDFFYSATEALGYATRWGRIWVDHRLRKIAERTVRRDQTEQQA